MNGFGKASASLLGVVPGERSETRDPIRPEFLKATPARDLGRRHGVWGPGSAPRRSSNGDGLAGTTREF